MIINEQQEHQTGNSIKRYELTQYDLWYQELLTTGCVVIKSVLNNEEVNKAQDAFWNWLQSLGSGIKRQDPKTWQNQYWPGTNDMGFFVSYGGCHTQTSWMVRTNPKVKQAFSKIWKTQKLISSFDTTIAWRPWWNEASKGRWQPYVQNLHLDQNLFFKKGLKCVQGMIPLKRVRNNQIGGLMIVPRSNSEQSQASILQRYPYVAESNSDWLQLSANDPLIGTGKLVECQAGDLVLWDSRTVHAGKVCQPSNQFKQAHKNDLVRMSVTVTMVPRQWCSEAKLKLRKKYFQQKIGTTHWPHEALKNGMGKMAQGIQKQNIIYKFPQLTKEIEDLV